jgi:Cu/Ag efflux pump CusA
MTVTIMFGLGFATLLTLIIVPVLYAIFYECQIQPDREAATNRTSLARHNDEEHQMREVRTAAKSSLSNLENWR